MEQNSKYMDQNDVLTYILTSYIYNLLEKLNSKLGQRPILSVIEST